MSDPLSLLSFALAARQGHVGSVAVSPLVAAGVTLLQRAAPLVRALAGGRSAILLPSGPALVVALAASDGREAVLLDPAASAERLWAQLEATGARALFSTSEFLPLLDGIWAAGRLAASGETNRAATGGATGAGTRRPVTVLLDGVPQSARVVVADETSERTIDVDLGSHHGLALEGDQQAEGRDEPCVLLWTAEQATLESALRLSHRDVFVRCRSLVASLDLTDRDVVSSPLPVHTPDGFIAAMASLLAGARLVGPREAASATVVVETPMPSTD